MDLTSIGCGGPPCDTQCTCPVHDYFNNKNNMFLSGLDTSKLYYINMTGKGYLEWTDNISFRDNEYRREYVARTYNGSVQNYTLEQQVSARGAWADMDFSPQIHYSTNRPSMEKGLFYEPVSTRNFVIIHAWLTHKHDTFTKAAELQHRLYHVHMFTCKDKI